MRVAPPHTLCTQEVSPTYRAAHWRHGDQLSAHNRSRESNERITQTQVSFPALFLVNLPHQSLQCNRRRKQKPTSQSCYATGVILDCNVTDPP